MKCLMERPDVLACSARAVRAANKKPVDLVADQRAKRGSNDPKNQLDGVTRMKQRDR